MRSVDNQIKERNRIEIEAKLNTMGDFVRMSYLQRALNSNLDFDTRKFVLLRLAGIYEVRKMYIDSAKLVKSAAEISVTFKEKISDFMRSIRLYIQGGDFAEADRLFGQALALGNGPEKMQMKEEFKNYYITQAKIYLNGDKRSYAKKTFEKVLTLDLDIGERAEVQKTLLGLYQRLGNIREFYKLQEKISKNN